MTHARRVTTLALLLASLAVSFSAIFIRIAGDGAATIVWLRMGMATALLAPWALRDVVRTKIRLAPRQLGLMLISACLLAAHFLLWTASLGLTSVAASVLLVSLHPLIVLPVAGRILGDRVPARAVAGAAVAVVGTVVTCWDGFSAGGAELLGDVLALGGALCLAGYLVIGRSLRNSTSVVVYSASVYAVVCIVAAAAALIWGTAHFPTARVAVVCLALAIVCTLGGHTVYNFVLRRVPAAVVSTAFLAEPPLTAALAFLLLASTPSPLTVAGGVVILAGLGLMLSRSTLTTVAAPVAALE